MGEITDLGHSLLDAAAELPGFEVHMAQAMLGNAADRLAGVNGDDGAALLQRSAAVLRTSACRLQSASETVADAGAQVHAYMGSLGMAPHVPPQLSMDREELERLTPDEMALVADAAADTRWHRRIVLHNTLDTFRGFDALDKILANGFNLRIRDVIRGKVVLDMGSGLGALAKCALAEEIPGEVHSVNPGLNEPKRKHHEETGGRRHLRHQYPHLSEARLDEIQRVHDARLSKRFAHQLNDFKDGQFDVIVDCVAVHGYMGDVPEVYRKTIREYARVLRPGGVAVIVDDAHQCGRMSKTGEDLLTFRRRAAFEAGLQYRLVTSHRFGPRGGSGAEGVEGALLWRR